MASEPRSHAPAGAWLGFFCVLVALGLHAASYYPFISDDALISLRYADRLLEGLGLTWSDGVRVEGYSNLLWLLASAALGALGLDLIDATRVLGGTCFAAVVWALARVAPSGDGHSPFPAVAASAALAASGTVAIWTVGGLEQPMVAALLAWALALLGGAERNPHAWAASIPLALLCWTRPDGPLFCVALATGWLLAHGLRADTLKTAATLCALPALATLSQLGFRLSYYGDWVPNPAHIKLHFSTGRMLEGAHYLALGLLWASPLLLPSAWLALRAARRDEATRRKLGVALIPLLVWCAYVVGIGGDIFPGRRHMTPLLVIIAFMLAVSLRSLAIRGPRAWLCLATGLAVFAVVQSLDPKNRVARRERWEWQGEVVGRLLAQAFAEERPLLAVDPAGTLPYFSRLPAIDMLGLNDRTIARTARRGPDGPLAHDAGNGSYVLDRKPDLVLFCLPSGGPRPCFRSGAEMLSDPRFAAHYRLARFEGADPFRFRSRIWVRAEDGRIGIERTDERVTVPAHLLTSLPRSAARLDAQGVLVVDASPGIPAAIVSLDVAPGSWRLQALADAALQTGVRRSQGRAVLALGGAVVDFELDAGPIDIMAAPAEGIDTVRIRGLELTRLSPSP